MSEQQTEGGVVLFRPGARGYP